ncbi:MAG: polyprenyl synthetase family protein [Pirellulales bacterium]|nr:polyprenyl synthetase family protein [Pirellulales bacterium]
MQNATLSFSEISQSLGPLIDAALDARTQLGEGCPARLREAMRYSLLAPGKRIRPLLALLAAQACGGSVEEAMPAACAVEMIHAYSLIHDDLPAMDDDDLRRGQPTCHKAFDEATAILAGDALLPLAFEILAGEITPPEVAVACCSKLAKAAGACNMAGGQADDVGNEGRGATASAAGEISDIDLLESIHHRKTGAMIECALQLGAIVAAADKREMEALEQFGRRLGMAFQITDDLLDEQSTEAEMGKRTGKDARRGKLTFPYILGLDRSRQYARQLVAEACEALAGFGPDAEGLRSLARFVLERNH